MNKVLRMLQLDKLPELIENTLVVSNENWDNLSTIVGKISEINCSTEQFFSEI